MNQSKALLLVFGGLFCFVQGGLAQSIEVERVEPAKWWVGMNNPELQLMVYGEDIGHSDVSIEHDQVELREVHQADNDNYLFLDLVIPETTAPGEVLITFSQPGVSEGQYLFPLMDRAEHERGLDAGDVIYLITPDRFANGDPSIDESNELKEGVDRSFRGGRHGGDLQGVQNKLDYMEELGISAIWLNPVLINDMPVYSYHGYATTDYFRVDPRLGSNESYRGLSTQMKARDMKLIKDIILNHVGLEHWWMNDMPFDDWIHDYPEYQITNHAKKSAADPYAALSDYRSLEKGWFVSEMPDLNHNNSFMARYLIQMTIWWIEYAGLEGLRIDTYPYNDKDFLETWVAEVMAEYPDLLIVGEAWMQSVPHTAYWSGAHTEESGPWVESLADFPLNLAIQDAFGDGGDVERLYNILSKDFLYADPAQNMIFADNHDMDRIYHTVGRDQQKFELAMAFILTTRGIPQIYYGTEILMSGSGDHGDIREDFPGGWEDDRRDAFTEEGRTAEENKAFDFLQTLLQWRKESNALTRGSLVHYVPQQNVYVYMRSYGDEHVVVALNNNAHAAALEMERFTEVTDSCTSGTDVLTGATYSLDQIEIGANTPLIISCD